MENEERTAWWARCSTWKTTFKYGCAIPVIGGCIIAITTHFAVKFFDARMPLTADSPQYSEQGTFLPYENLSDVTRRAFRADLALKQPPATSGHGASPEDAYVIEFEYPKHFYGKEKTFVVTPLNITLPAMNQGAIAARIVDTEGVLDRRYYGELTVYYGTATNAKRLVYECWIPVVRKTTSPEHVSPTPGTQS